MGRQPRIRVATVLKDRVISAVMRYPRCAREPAEWGRACLPRQAVRSMGTESFMIPNIRMHTDQVP